MIRGSGYEYGETSGSGGETSELQTESESENTAGSEGYSESDEEEGLTFHEESETETQPEVSGYLLARDRTRRNVRPPSRYEDANLVAYALSVSEDIEPEEPKSFAEAKLSKK